MDKKWSFESVHTRGFENHFHIADSKRLDKGYDIRITREPYEWLEHMVKGV